MLLLATTACTGAEPPDVDAAVFDVALASCQQNNSNRATAVAIGDGLALTVAHSFDDAVSVVLRADDGSERMAQLVYIDRERDIALLSFTGDTAAKLEIRSDDDAPADEGRIVVRRDGATIEEPVQLLRRTAVTLDGDGRRDGIELGGAINPGDSGAPLIDDDGRIIGLVFASSRATDTGWAIAGSELLDVASLAGDPIPLTCPPTGGAGG